MIFLICCWIQFAAIFQKQRIRRQNRSYFAIGNSWSWGRYKDRVKEA
jgi:hypothetical protein